MENNITKNKKIGRKEMIFWYLAGIITMDGIYTIAWLIETLLSQN